MLHTLHLFERSNKINKAYITGKWNFLLTNLSLSQMVKRKHFRKTGQSEYFRLHDHVKFDQRYLGLLWIQFFMSDRGYPGVSNLSGCTVYYCDNVRLKSPTVKSS